MNSLDIFWLNSRHGLNDFEQVALVLVLVAAGLSLVYAWWLRSTVLKKDKGTDKMQEVWNAIREGADSYLSQQLKTILPLIAVLTVVMFLSVYVVPPSAEASQEFGTFGPQGVTLIIAIGRTIAFIMGASFSLIVGQWGMRMAVQANVRVASASRRGFNEALSIAYYAGTYTGMLTDGLGLLGGTVLFIIFGKAAPDALLGFGFGGTLLALFMRVGGGIYTKAADVGADLVGKVEKDIPEDDPRNAAVIADLVGDNVGDCAGMAADLFETYAVTTIAAIMLGASVFKGFQGALIYPLALGGIAIIASIIGTWFVRMGKTQNIMGAMYKGLAVAGVIAAAAFFPVTTLIMSGNGVYGVLGIFGCTIVGLLVTAALVIITEYYTSTKYNPVKSIALASVSGH